MRLMEASNSASLLLYVTCKLTQWAKQRKSAIEEELQIYAEVIKTQGTDMTSPLVDREGFPRADIDVASVRTARARVHRLRNDLKDVMEAIAAALQNVYARPDDAGKTIERVVPEQERAIGERPFALVNGVAPSSPAEHAVRYLFLASLALHIVSCAANRAFGERTR
jgi:Nas2 N_terminal domain